MSFVFLKMLSDINFGYLDQNIALTLLLIAFVPFRYSNYFLFKRGLNSVGRLRVNSWISDVFEFRSHILNLFLDPIDSITRMMGHSSSKTTERYYCRKTSESAISNAQKVWRNVPKTQEVARSEKVKNPLIDEKICVTGYA